MRDAVGGVRLLLSPPENAPHLGSAEALQYTNLYATLIQPAVPLRRDTLAEIWRRCTDSPEACAEGRASAEVQVGALVPGDARSRADAEPH